MLPTNETSKAQTARTLLDRRQRHPASPDTWVSHRVVRFEKVVGFAHTGTKGFAPTARRYRHISLPARVRLHGGAKKKEREKRNRSRRCRKRRRMRCACRQATVHSLRGFTTPTSNLIKVILFPLSVISKTSAHGAPVLRITDHMRKPVKQ